MIEITAIGMGLMMTAMAVAIGGLMLEATLLTLGRALATLPPAASLEFGELGELGEPGAIRLS